MLRSLVTHVILVVTLACSSVACASNSSPPTPSSSSSSSSTSEASDAEAEEQAVIDAYLAAIDAFYLAANPPDPDHPALAATHAGDLLSEVRASLRELDDGGVALRKGPLSAADPAVIALDGDIAFIEDCAVDADIQFEVATGEVVDDSVIFGRFTAQLERRGAGWVVTAIDFEELEEPCTSGASS